MPDSNVFHYRAYGRYSVCNLERHGQVAIISPHRTNPGLEPRQAGSALRKAILESGDSQPIEVWIYAQPGKSFVRVDLNEALEEDRRLARTMTATDWCQLGLEPRGRAAEGEACRRASSRAQ